MAARATWSGIIQFGMVSIPAKMYTATDGEKKIEFNQLNSITGNRINQKRVDAVTGEEVPFDQIVKGYMIAKDVYVRVSDEELEEVAPDKNSTIEILNFVEPDQIDDLYVDKPYYLGSDKADKPYALLNAALANSGKVAVAKFVMRSKEYLAVIRPVEHGLALHTLRWADEVRTLNEIKPPRVQLTEKEITMATTLVESMAEEFNIVDFKDEHRDRIMAMIEAKSKGIELPKVEHKAQEPTEDLLAALEASLAVAKARKAG